MTKRLIYRCFVTDIGVNKVAAAIVKAIAALAEALKKEVIVEGIETREQLASVARSYCQYELGYLFSEPISAQNFAVLVATEEKQLT